MILIFLHDLQSDSDVAIANKVQTGKEKPYEKIDYQNVGDKVQKPRFVSGQRRVKVRDHILEPS